MQSRRNQLLQSAIAGGIVSRRTTPDEVEVRAEQILRRQIHLCYAAGASMTTAAELTRSSAESFDATSNAANFRARLTILATYGPTPPSRIASSGVNGSSPR